MSPFGVRHPTVESRVMHQTALCSTLVDAVAVRGSAHARAIRIAAVAFITALTAAAAQLSIPVPFTVVPFTLQPMVVLLGGLALGSRLGLASQVLYLLAGIAGLPVFAASATLPPGALRLLGPTGGYLLAYPIAALLVGHLAERGFDRCYVTSILVKDAASIEIYTSGYDVDGNPTDEPVAYEDRYEYILVSENGRWVIDDFFAE